MTRPSACSVDDAERRAHLRDDDRRGSADALCSSSSAAKVDVEQLVAVQREHGAVLAATRGGESQSAAAAERLGLAYRLDLGAEPAERIHERLLLSGAAGDDHAGDARACEPRDGVLGEREAGDRHERLR